MKVPYIDLGVQHQPIIDKLTDKTRELLLSGQFILGDEVKTFEQTFAEYCGTKYAIAVNSGTDALILAMQVAGIKLGDEIITAPNSFLASASSIALAGATIKFADVASDMNIDPEKIQTSITSKTKAIMPVHLTGNPAKMDEINTIAQKHDLIVIEDAAQAVGASYKNKKTGNLSHFGCFSLHPLKNLSACGDGGIITTNNEKWYKMLVSARNHGLINRDECETWSMNSRLDNLQAAFLNIKMDYIEGWNENRRTNAAIYNSRLKDIVKIPEVETHCISAHHTYIIQTDKRDELQEFLKQNEIDSKIHYPIPIHLQKASKNTGYKKGDFPVTEKQSKHILSLPIYPELSSEQINYVCDKIIEFFNIS